MKRMKYQKEILQYSCQQESIQPPLRALQETKDENLHNHHQLRLAEVLTLQEN